ncbi:major facilitator superfamily domain-containing protein [Schizothecium vesticola]|uniref:Major facilitator superfamily domain-containing protein n=1 Tax=Schizothecium vesticola TaxID=314040 RepID=A0AA40FA38_9PEZI|nr:major facilitator superfamily domain-containing protein [Schizothecium vesticola]
MTVPSAQRGPHASTPAPSEKTSGKASVSNESPIDTDSSEVEEFKEGGYGWVVVASVLLVNAHTWGLNSSFAIFLAYYLRTGIIQGATPMTFAFVGGLSISMALLTSPLATVCIAKLGTRWTLRIGVVLQAASFVGASFSLQIWQLLLSQGVCFGIGLGFCFTSTVGIVSQWFTKRRSFANALSTSGSGFGGLIYALATNAMIQNLGLEWAFRIIAILSFVVNGAVSLIIRDRNKAVGAIHVAFHFPLLKKPEFWLYMSWGFFSMIGYVITVFSLTDYAQSVGFAPSRGSIVAAVFNLSQGVGRPLIGLSSDKYGRLNIAGLGTLAAGLSCFFIWIFAGKTYAGLIVYALFGVFSGVIWPCVAPVGAEVVGLQLLPSALSIYWLGMVLPATFAEVIALVLKNPGVNGYIHVQIFTGVMYLAAFASIWLLRSWKLRQIDTLSLDDEKEEESGLRGQHIAPAQIPAAALSYFRAMITVKRI